MADTFDPYHVWLGISPASQPPNHYRLLGIELFEQSGDVIDAAASRQSMMLRDFISGEHDKLAEKLLEEVKVARVSLLNPQEKSKYDEQLRSELTDAGEKFPEVTGQGKAEEASPGYHLWLGITPGQQPPTHYRLLGLDPFEASAEVIEAGADRQSRYLREVAVGKHRKQSQSLLNEVSAARRCLLDTEKRKAYDEELRLKAEQVGSSKEVEPAKESVIPKTEVADAGDSETPKTEVSEPSAPHPQETSNDASKADGSPAVEADVDTPNVDSSKSAIGKIDQPASESLPSTEPDKAAFPTLVEPAAPTNVAANEASSDPKEDSRRKMFVIIGSVTAAVLLVGTGLFFWLNGSESPASPKVASTNFNIKQKSDAAKEPPGAPLGAVDPPESKEGDEASNQFEQLLAASKLAGDDAKPPAKPAPKPANNRAAARAARKKAAAKRAADARAAAAKKSAPPPFREVRLPQVAKTVSSQFWKNVNAEFADLVKTPPTARGATRILKSLAAGARERLGPKAFQRVRGVLIPPSDGDYKFHVKIAGQGKLLVGEGLGQFPRKEVKDGQTVKLSGSQNYFFEVLHLDKTGEGGFNVGWTLPNGVKEIPIPGGRAAWTPFLVNFAAMHRTKLQSTENLTVEPVKESDLMLASSDARGNSKVTLEYQSDITTWSAFQLSAHVNKELQPKGLGLGARGMFSLNELTLEYQEPGATDFVPVALTAPVARVGIPDGLVDGNPSTKWTVRESDVDSVSVILVPEKRLTVPPQTKLRVTLHQDVPLGLFRFRGTASNAAGKIGALRQTIEKDNAPYALRVNLGGGYWKDATNNMVWVKPKAYAEGSWGFEGGTPVPTQASENAPKFLKSALSGIRAFRADVPNGKYDVTLFFVAHGVRKAGERVFSVQVETLPPASVDLFQVTSGGKTVFAPSTEVVVKDGRLDIVLKRIAGQPPILNAVSITE